MFFDRKWIKITLKKQCLYVINKVYVKKWGKKLMKNKKILLKILIIITVLIAIVLILEKVYADKIPASGTLRDEANEKAMIKNCVWKLCKEDSNGTITGTKMASKMNKYLSSDKVTVKENQTEKTLYITYSKSGRTYTLKTDTLELIGEDVGGTMGGTYLPTGFKQVIGTTLANGLTIQDSTGNQYVWVEVPQTTEVYPTAGLKITDFTTDEYTKIEEDLHTYTSDYREDEDDYEYEYEYKDEYYSDATTGLTSAQYTELKQKMLKSVYKNGGFYVGKYETGIENAPKTSGSSSTIPTEIPVIKQNAYPYINVTCSQAQTLASKMESGNYTSSLMFGVQWDLVLKYLETKGTTQEDLKTDSTNWGNYKNNLWNITNENSKYSPGSRWTNGAYGKKDSIKSVLLSTGASETFSKQGIYDIAGNVWEWTLEYTDFSRFPCAKRGGGYSDNGSAAYRSYDSTTSYYDLPRLQAFTLLIVALSAI